MSTVAEAPIEHQQQQPPSPRSNADRVMRRILRLPVDGRRGTPDEARKAFQTSVLVAALRCTLMYVVFPFVLPALGIAAGVGPVIGLVVNTVAMIAIVMSLRRYFGSDHPQRWTYAAIGGAVMVLLVVLAVVDVNELLR